MRLLKIGDITKRYPLSARTLRFWEDSGIIHSTRDENGYRLYDEQTLNRIKQVIILRKLDLSLKDIEVIYRDNSLQTALVILKRHMAKIQNQASFYQNIESVINHLILLLQNKQNLENMFQELDVSKDLTLIQNQQTLSKTFDKGELIMNNPTKSNELRIVQLPNYIFAECSSCSDHPEDDAWALMLQLMQQHQLHKQPGFRHFGYGQNRAGDGKYVYHILMTIPSSLILQEPYHRIELTSGLYAVIPATLATIMERWHELHNTILESKEYTFDDDVDKQNLCLEEILDMESFFKKDAPISERQLDLLLPIKRIKSSEEEITDAPITHQVATLKPQELIGSFFDYNPSVSLQRLTIPWYKLAQNLYTLKEDLQSSIEDGQNTFAFIYNDVKTSSDFFSISNKQKVARVYAAVKAVRELDNHPSLKPMIISPGQYLCFSMSSQENIQATKHLNYPKLFNYTWTYLIQNNISFDKTFFIRRDYRFDGRTVHRVELYFKLL